MYNYNALGIFSGKKHGNMWPVYWYAIMVHESIIRVQQYIQEITVRKKKFHLTTYTKCNILQYSLAYKKPVMCVRSELVSYRMRVVSRKSSSFLI